jgi:hypothetical protein
MKRLLLIGGGTALIGGLLLWSQTLASRVNLNIGSLVSNPPAGQITLWGSSSDGLLHCNTSTGASCLSGGGGGGTPGGIPFSTQYNLAGSFAGVGPGAAGTVFIAQGVAAPGWVPVTGDGGITALGVLTVTRSNGSPFGTAAFVNLGTSGTSLGLLNGNLTFSGSNNYGTPASINLTNGSNLPLILTTSGSSGAATYSQSTSTLNIPNYPGGTVTSVGLLGTSNQITVTGATPITGAGSWTLAFPTGGVTLPGTTTFAAITGSTQCLQVNSSGVLAGTGSACGSGGSSVNIETNGTPNLSQSILNVLNSIAFNGLTLTFTNASAGNVQAGFSGTLGNAGLTNSAITIAGTSVALGGSTSSLPSPGAIGGTTPASAAFTTLSASSTVTLSGLATGTQVSCMGLSSGNVVVLTSTACGAGSMVYPGAGIPISTGSAWGTSITATTAGTVIYWNGTAWTTLTGNTSGTQYLQETSAGVPSWSTGTGTTAFSGITSGTNTSAAMLVGSGASLGFTGTGTIAANNTGFGLALSSGNIAVNTAVISSITQVQNNIVSCKSTNGTISYTCSFVANGHALTAYQTNMYMLLVTDTTSTSSSNVNIDTLGAITLKQYDGVTGVGTSQVAGQAQWYWYDGTYFRQVNPPASGTSLFASFQFGSQTAITGSGVYLQTTYPSIFVTTQTGSGTSGSPFVDAITLAPENANTFWRGPTSGSAAAPTFGALVTADFPASGVAAGTYTCPTITFDSTGRATSASNGSCSGGGSSPGTLLVSAPQAPNNVSLLLGSDAFSIQGNVTFTGAFNTIFTVTAQTALTLPTSGTLAVAGASPSVQFCGTTSSCSATSQTNAQVVYGSVPLVSGTPSTATVTGISPAFTSSTSYKCQVTAQSSASTALLSVANVSGSSFTITGPATATTVINYACTGI